MIDINLIRSNPDAVKASLKKKECDVDFSELLSWDAERRALISDGVGGHSPLEKRGQTR